MKTGLSLGVIIGIIFAFIGIRARIKASGGSDPAQKITCAKLGASGYGNNRYVEMTNFKASKHYAFHRAHAQDVDWQYMLVPAIPDGAPDSGFTVLIKSNATGSVDYDALRSKPSVSGMIHTSAYDLPSVDRLFLEERFKSADWNKVIILDVDESPPDPLVNYTLIIGGVLLTLICGVGLAAANSNAARKNRLMIAGLNGGYGQFSGRAQPARIAPTMSAMPTLMPPQSRPPGR